MARNEEKAQSMLYRFRQAKAMEMGLGGAHSDKRPRIAATCKDLRQCERWRGEILREISRKVTKIQDYGLSDYEVRDLNDEINKLMREKNHWENQIAALGGANYRRAGSSIKDKDGKEVPGTRGYKYFGRAKELPGVKELFASTKKDQDELTSYKRQRYSAYEHVGPEYYGDLGQDIEDMMISAEREAEEEEWEDAKQDVAETLGLDLDSLQLPPLPKADYVNLPMPTASTSTALSSSADIPPPPPPLPEADGKNNDATTEGAEEPEAEPETATTGSKRKTRASARGKGKKAKEEPATTAATTVPDEPASKSTRTKEGEQSASGANKILSVLTEDAFKMPSLPSLEELEAFVVAKQKEELLNEYV